MESREEKCRKLAEWLGIKHDRFCELMTGGLKCDCHGKPPDFYISEEACALLLEKMRRPLLVSDWPGCEGWRVDIGVQAMTPVAGFPNAVGGKLLGPTHLDRKTAIIEAALALIEKEAR
jgi:hypothetical protein